MAGSLILAMILGPWLFYRVTSPLHRIRITASEGQPVENRFSGTLKVLVWNIAHGRGTQPSNWSEGPVPKLSRVMDMAATIRELDADIVILNEVDFSATWSGGVDQAALLAEQAGYPWLVRQANLDCGYWYGRWQFGNAVLSRYPVSSADVVELQPLSVLEDWLAGSKRGVLCQIQVAPEKHIQVMAVHLEYRSESARVVSADAIAERVASRELPLIVAGDLNTTPAEAPHATPTAGGENAFEILIEKTGLAKQPAGLPSFDDLTFPSWQPRRAIDWILFAPESFRPLEHRVIRSRLSDHLPVLGTFELLPR